jgi:hypothetical protein
MKYRIKQGVDVDYDPWINRYVSKPIYHVEERFLYFFWFRRLSFFDQEEAISYLNALKAMS